MNVVRDALGRELKVGDFIMYARNVGSTAHLAIGLVRSVNPDSNRGAFKIGIFNERGIKTGLTCTDRCVFVHEDAIPDSRGAKALLAPKRLALLLQCGAQEAP